MNDSAEFVSQSIDTRSGLRQPLNESGFNRTAFTTLKITVFAPMPRASAKRIAAASPGCRRKERSEYRMSCHRVPISKSTGASGIEYIDKADSAMMSKI